MVLKPSNPQDVKILVIGDVMLDVYNYGDANRISPEAPVPVFHSKEKKYYLGGAANTFLNLHNAEIDAYLFGRIGDDWSGNVLKSMILKLSDVPKCCLFWDSKNPTITKERIVARSQQIVRVDTEIIEPLTNSLIEMFYSAYLNAIFKRDFDAIIISDYGKGTICYNLIELLMSDPSFYNTNIFVDPFPSNSQFYKSVSYITPNLKEYEAMGGLDILKTILNIKNVIRTEGEHGITVFNEELGEYHIDTEAQTVYDVSGAGDTVIAILAAAVSMGYTLKDAVKLANQAAGSVVSTMGTTAVDPDFIKEKIKELQNGDSYAKSS